MVEFVEDLVGEFIDPLRHPSQSSRFGIALGTQKMILLPENLDGSRVKPVDNDSRPLITMETFPRKELVSLTLALGSFEPVVLVCEPASESLGLTRQFSQLVKSDAFGSRKKGDRHWIFDSSDVATSLPHAQGVGAMSNKRVATLVAAQVATVMKLGGTVLFRLAQNCALSNAVCHELTHSRKLPWQLSSIAEIELCDEHQVNHKAPKRELTSQRDNNLDESANQQPAAAAKHFQLWVILKRATQISYSMEHAQAPLSRLLSLSRVVYVSEQGTISSTLGTPCLVSATTC